jgi:hypothetical protein
MDERSSSVILGAESQRHIKKIAPIEKIVIIIILNFVLFFSWCSNISFTPFISFVNLPLSVLAS